MVPATRVLLGLSALSAAMLSVAHCPHMCSGHGRCGEVSRCECFTSWDGSDCSQRKCPQGKAWSDVAIGNDVAHQPAKCSNRGKCNTATGICDCMDGFEGLACSRMQCPSKCNGHGVCLTMRQYATKLDKGLQPRPYYTYASNWDADLIHGCSCDGGYVGWDCSERECPSGDDPMTITQVDEVQLIRCDLDGASTTKEFTLSYRGAVTEPFAPSATALEIKGLLEALPTLTEVNVAFSRGFTFCNRDFAPFTPPGGNIVSITFLMEHGDVPSIVPLDNLGALLTGIKDNSVFTAADGESLTYSTSVVTNSGTTVGTGVAMSVTGTKELLSCNGRGTCNRLTGECACFAGYASSDGFGRIGKHGDCGYVTLPITACPGYPECSSHGVCSGNPSYKCSCFDGWGGGDCSERTCPFGPAWFNYPSANGVAHTLAECSNKGRCNRASGACECQGLFEGEACERTTCPGSTFQGGIKTSECSGHGRCMSMADLATFATVNGDATPYTYGADPNNKATWDARGVYGCLCDEGFGGYDCADRVCPVGEDITLQEWDESRVNEIQTLTCRLLSSTRSPYFRLRFRQAETEPILPSATVAELTAALEALPTVAGVSVSYGLAGNIAACTSSPGTSITFAFQRAHGDLPPLQVIMDESSRLLDGTYASGDGWDDNSLEFSGGDPANDYRTAFTYVKGPSTGYDAGGVRTREYLKGTSGSETCSGRGICDQDTGVCKCFPGFGPSDGNRGRGLIEDCGFREPFQDKDEDWQRTYAGY